MSVTNRVRTVVVLMPLLASVSCGDRSPAPARSWIEHAQAGITRFVEGAPAAEAFAPWAVEEAIRGQDAEIRKALESAKATSARPMTQTQSMYFVRDGQKVLTISTTHWLASGSPLLLKMARGSEIGDPEDDSDALEDHRGAAKAFADLALDVKSRLVADSWKTLPWADPADLRRVLPEGPLLSEALASLAKREQSAEYWTTELAGKAPDGMRLGLGMIHFAVHDAAGTYVGSLGWGLYLDAERGIRVQLHRFTPRQG